MLFRVVFERWEEADGLVVVTQAEVDDLDEELDRNAVLHGDLAHRLRLLEVIVVAEGVEVLLGLPDDLVVLVHHGDESNQAGVVAFLLLLGLASLTLGDEVGCLRHRDLEGVDFLRVCAGYGVKSDLLTFLVHVND